ncbi:hypothetical protein [Dysgonomonas sp. 25]|uniref:hypothetical protein n=1 Tax=Dysgonomonas sp. 25 TaxID=2302933 RepID=UPI0013D2C119|nr:hypothetical protein [Dysgonomonas sp. 25]NDV69246.1 hypothetical protein [Dysgonomonas sp. 25]
MKQIELYINHQLCDIGEAKDFAVYLKRQFISPVEVSAKDTQRSYEITLPASNANNAIFGYINTEEVKGKFATLYPAQLIMGGVKILDGYFKLTEVTSRAYKGNLGTPPARTIKEIFGDKTMNKAGSYPVPFPNLAMISQYNQSQGAADMRFFFPLVMYGLLPKVPAGSGLYGAKDGISDNVRFGLEDFPPSLNCLDTLKNIFKSHKLNITGTAFSDERLKNLYMSYKNPSNFDMPWNYGDLGTIKIKGQWDNCWFLPEDEGVNKKQPKLFETTGFLSTTDGDNRGAYTANMLNSTNLKKLTVLEDLGENITSYTEDIKDYKVNNVVYPRKKYHHSIRIPMSGYYKVSLKGDIYIPRRSDPDFFDFSHFHITDGNTGYIFASGDHKSDNDDYLNDKRFELKLIRDRGEGDFTLDGITIDGIYYQNNQEQTQEGLKIKDDQAGKTDGYVYPPIQIPVFNENYPLNFKPNQTVFVDPAQNDKLVIGIAWGAFENGRYRAGTPFDRAKGRVDGYDNDENPKRHLNPVWARTLAAKSCHSWNNNYKDKTLSYVLVNQPTPYIKCIDPSENGNANQEDFVLEETRMHKIVLKNAPVNYARRGYYKGEAKPIIDASHKDRPVNWYGDGEMNAIVWFEKGERVTLISTSDTAKGGSNYWLWHKIDFELSIEPYRRDKGWAQINEFTGSSIAELDWNSKPEKDYDFPKDTVDVIRFLPSEVKVDEWIDNFCKAFNLELIQHNDKNFELNIRKKLSGNTSLILDLDQKADVNVNRQNIPFGLPKAYEIGFTVDKDEIGFVESTRRLAADGDYERDPMGEIKAFEGNDGGGRFETGSPESNVVKQTSNFSYNWMKAIKSEDSNFYKDGVFPVISDKEVWGSDSSDYAEMMMKSYTDKAQRFWYKADGSYRVKINNKVEVDAALVTDTFDKGQRMELDYKDKPDSILRNYFTILADAQNCYTQVECYLSPEEYDMLEHCLIRFNGDLYHAAEVEGYDPLGMRKTTLKLIRKML